MRFLGKFLLFSVDVPNAQASWRSTLFFRFFDVKLDRIVSCLL